jgi:hypothetical protein
MRGQEGKTECGLLSRMNGLSIKKKMPDQPKGLNKMKSLLGL